MGTPGRVPPHSVPAEEAVIACCLIDGNDSVARCIDGKITPISFYVPANQLIFNKLLALYNDRRPIDAAVLAQELATAKQLDEVGGYAYIMRVSDAQSTTANLQEMVNKVRQLAVLREIIHAATGAVEDCYGFTGDLSLIAKRISDATRVLDDATTTVSSNIRSLDTFSYPLDDPNILIGAKGRYLGKGGSLLIPAPAGIGKSTASYQLAACWGTGRPFLGTLEPVRALRVLIIQVEDDDGDVGEMFTSVDQGLELGERDRALVRQNVAVVRDRRNIGDDFHPALKRYVRHFKPEIVIINPLMRYCPGLSKEEVAGPFLSKIDQIADEHGFACVAFHHTPKPPSQDGTKGKPAKKDAVDRQYTAFGSSALTNWPRAIINIAKVKGQDGVFVFQFDKRGKRAGVTRGSTSGNWVETVTELVVKHSTRKIKVGGREFPMVLWEPHDNQHLLDEIEEEDAPKSGKKSAPTTYTKQEVLAQYPFGEKNAIPLAMIERRAIANRICSANQFKIERVNLYGEGLISRTTNTDTGEERWYRTA